MLDTRIIVQWGEYGTFNKKKCYKLHNVLALGSINNNVTDNKGPCEGFVKLKAKSC